MFSKATELGLFKAAEIGKDKIRVSHLQFADDTIIMGASDNENAWTMKRVLCHMEALSGLKINFDKCSISGINVEDERLQEVANILGCRVGGIPFSYLGLKVGIDHRRISEWAEILHKIRNRLKRWDDKNISLGGRITLLNSVFTSPFSKRVFRAIFFF
ncbi:hypothetical protein ACS0TY_025756 [Phlomoides rotata]